MATVTTREPTNQDTPSKEASSDRLIEGNGTPESAW